MKNTIPILFAFDSNFILAAGVCLTSLLENAGPDTFYDIFILHKPDPSIPNGELLKVANRYGNCRITFREVTDDFNDGYVIRGITETTYFRLIASEMIPEYDKIIYSDVDVIFREDLTYFYDLDIGDNYFAGVDSLPVLSDGDMAYVRTILEDKINNGYFYAGNLIINLKQLREDNKTTEFRSLAGKQFKFQDMDIINLTCSGRILPIGPSFCLSTYYYDAILLGHKTIVDIFGSDELDHAIRSGILHFNGVKPWKEICPNVDIWWFWYRKSVFFDEEFNYSFWERYRVEKMSLLKRIKFVARYFRKGGRVKNN